MSDIGPGDFVECVDASPPAWPDLSLSLVLGAIYTVVEVVGEAEGPDGSIGDALVLDRSSSRRDPWDIRRFRPVRRPNPSLIQSLLRPVDEGVRV